MPPAGGLLCCGCRWHFKEEGELLVPLSMSSSQPHQFRGVGVGKLGQIQLLSDDWVGRTSTAPNLTDSFWNPNAFETDSDLPAGWMRVQDTSGTYYWHIPTGTTQWEPPGRASPSQGSSPREESSQVSMWACGF